MAKPPVQVNIFSLLSPYPNDPNKYLHCNPFFIPIHSFQIFSLDFSVSIFFAVVLGFLQKIKSCDHTMRKPCCDKQDTNKGAWSKQEDQKLIDYIRKHGEGYWRTLPQAAGLLRCGKSCRLRWINYLRPDLKRGNFAEDEEDLIIKLHALLGNRWSLIAGRLPGRTDNEVKNYWNSHLRRKLINMGIDPNNHKLYHSLPRPQNPNNSTSATSSGLKVETNHQPAVISHVGGGVDNDQASDAGSCLEDESCGLPDLNLDLSITIPSTPSPGKAKEEKNTNELNIKEQVFGPSPTLVLFQ